MRRSHCQKVWVKKQRRCYQKELAHHRDDFMVGDMKYIYLGEWDGKPVYKRVRIAQDAQGEAQG
jgi:uncharacterized protein (DUF779 family)